MTPVSRRKLAKEAEEKILKVFIQELAKISEEEKLESFMALLLSGSERIMLAKRLAAFVLIEKQIPDAQISRSLNLTTVTVAKLRFAYWFSKEKSEPVADIIQNPKLVEIFTDLFERVLINYAIPAMGGRPPRSFENVFKPVKRN